MIQELTVIGAMSGTSLDGLDLCCARFWTENNKYHYEILACKTYPYAEETIQEIKAAYYTERNELGPVHHRFGALIGETILSFIKEFHLESKVDLIGSHGQTIFHEPDKGFTVQIGDGQTIADITNLSVINDFRSKDVELGGQGAPLVPIGDKLLFSEFDSCLNLGGIANISFAVDDLMIAFDISPANQPLNLLVSEYFGKAYDKDGEIAKTGKVIPSLLSDLNALSYYHQEPPKSLGYEWMDSHFYPELDCYPDDPVEDLVRTILEHETEMIARELTKQDLKSCLVTGGGAYNDFFIERLKAKTNTEIILPDNQLIEFKEALIFGFLAFLNFNNQINTLSSVTGAKSDSIGGKRYSPLG